MLPLLIGLAALAAPAPPTLDAATRARLDQGEIVLRQAADSSQVTALVHFPGPPARVWDIIADPVHLKASSGAVQTLEVYCDRVRPDGQREQCLGYVIKVAFMEVEYNVIRVYDLDQGVMTWTLDRSRDNDIVDTTGTFTTWPEADGGTLFSYQVNLDSGRSVPEFIARELREASVKKFLTYVQRVSAP